MSYPITGTGGGSTPAVSSFRLAEATPLVLGSTLASTFSISGTGATKADEFVITKLSASSIKVVGTTAAYGTASLDKTGLNLDLSSSDHFNFIWYTDDISKVVNVTVLLCSDTSGFTNYAKVNCNITTFPQYSTRCLGWNINPFIKSEMELTGTVDWSSIKQIRFQVVSGASTGTAYIDSLWVNCKTRAKAIMSWDDGWKEIYDFENGKGMFTYMTSKGLKGSISIIGGTVAQFSTYMTHAQINEIYEAGWDVLTHGVEYNGHAANYQQLPSFPTEAEALLNVQYNKTMIDSMGWRGNSDIYVWPQGAYTLTLEQSLMDKGFRAARSTQASLAASYFPDKDYFMHLPCANLGGATFAQLQPWVDKAIANGSTVIFCGHRLQTAPGATGIFQQVDEWTQLVDYLADNRASIDTIMLSEWLAGVKPIGR